MAKPRLKQYDLMDCGAVCLQYIASHYGKQYSLQRLRELCHITKNGVSMLGISDAAGAIGLRSLGAKLTWEQLRDDALLPCVVHWNQRHFVVVKSIKKRFGNDYVYVYDPAVGELKYKRDDFLKPWQQLDDDALERRGAALLLSPKPEFYQAEDDSNKKRNFSSGVLQYLRPYRKALAQTVFAMLVASLVSMLFPYLTQAVVDTGIGTGDIKFVIVVLVAQLFLVIGQMANDMARSWLMLHINTRVSIALVSDFLSRLMHMPIRFFDSKNTGDIMQRVRDNERIRSFLTSTLISTSLSAVTFVVYVAIISSYNCAILLVFLVGSAVYVAWVSAFMRKRRKLDYMHFQQVTAEQNKLLQIIGGMQEIKLNNCEQTKRWEWEKIQARLFYVNTKSMVVGNMQNYGGSLIDQAKNIVILFISAKSVIDGVMSFGELVALQYIIGQLNAPLYQFIEFLQSLQDAKISAERMGDIKGMDSEIETNQGKSVDIPSDADIVLKDVTFQYDGPRSPKVIDSLSLVIPANKVTAIVGVSGSGKTTLLKLLLRFFEPSSGSIKLGNGNLADYDIRAWRRNCGVVMQEGFIFSDTILNNIGISEENPDRDKAAEAAQQACIDDAIDALPARYNTRVGSDGHGLSSGQKQRLLIARAIYKNAKYLFLDEATNSLDANNERRIMDNLQTFFHNKTVVVVAHRLSTVRNADNIVVIDNGHLVEQGRHDDLVAMRGAYFNLVRNQLELGN